MPELRYLPETGFEDMLKEPPEKSDDAYLTSNGSVALSEPYIDGIVILGLDDSHQVDEAIDPFTQSKSKAFRWNKHRTYGTRWKFNKIGSMWGIH